MVSGPFVFLSGTGGAGATDRAVDRETHAHSLEYWNDPDLENVRQAITPLQVRLSKMDDAKRKQQGIEKLLQTLQAMEF